MPRKSLSWIFVVNTSHEYLSRKLPPLTEGPEQAHERAEEHVAGPTGPSCPVLQPQSQARAHGVGVSACHLSDWKESGCQKGRVSSTAPSGRGHEDSRPSLPTRRWHRLSCWLRRPAQERSGDVREGLGGEERRRERPRFTAELPLGICLLAMAAWLEVVEARWWHVRPRLSSEACGFGGIVDEASEMPRAEKLV